MAETEEDIYDALLTTLFKEMNKKFTERNQDYYTETLNLFSEAGETDSEHHLWRHEYMIQEMISILTSHERRQNTWKYEVFSSYNDPEHDPEPYINVEVFPSIARKDLELMAAQIHIQKTKNLLVKTQEISDRPTIELVSQPININKSRNKIMLEGDTINFKELDRIGENYEKGSLRKQCERRAMIIRAKGLELPQPLYKNQSSALNYAITALPEEGQDITSGMLFKKIAYSKKT